MKLETERLLIRSLKPDDERAFIDMASDGSLHEIFGDCTECYDWMGDWIGAKYRKKGFAAEAAGAYAQYFHY